MERNQVLKKINEIFIDIFEDNSIVLNENSTTSDVDAWDSLNHIQMIMAVERHFKIRFKINDLLNFKNVGDLCSGILKEMKKST